MPKPAGHSLRRIWRVVLQVGRWCRLSWRVVRQWDPLTMLAQTAAVGLPWLLLLGERGAVAYGALALVVLLWCCVRELREP